MFKGSMINNIYNNMMQMMSLFSLKCGLNIQGLCVSCQEPRCRVRCFKEINLTISPKIEKENVNL